MNSQKHTDGPWHITKDKTAHQFVTLTKVRDSHEGVIAVMHVNEDANARLISAAPDLLAALKQAYDTLGWAQHFLSHANKQAIPDTLEIISAAIAKAEGNT